jgi:PLAT/LH2 domain/CARDB
MKLKVKTPLYDVGEAELSCGYFGLRNRLFADWIVGMVTKIISKLRQWLTFIAVLIFVLLVAAWLGNPAYALPRCPAGADCPSDPPEPPEPSDPSEPPRPEHIREPELMVTEQSVRHTTTEWLGSFTVSNVGAQKSDAFQVILAEGTNIIKTYDLPSLAGHKGHNLNFSLPYNPADCRIVNLTVTVYSLGAVAEWNEENNVVAIIADPCPPPPPPPPLNPAEDDRKVWRAQIRLVTGNITDAGTDDSVKVELNNGNRTWIDYGRDDFERNDDFTYDLNLDNISKISDIRMLKISKPGGDGWCLRSLELIINGQPIYSASSQQFYYGCWLDDVGTDHTSIRISDVALHKHLLWKNYQQPSPSPVIKREEMESRIESIMGDTIYYNSLRWGHISVHAVEATRLDDQALHVDLDLEYLFDHLANPEVDVDFDLRFSCQEGKINIKSENVVFNVDSPWWEEVLTLGFVELIDSKVRRGIENAFKPISKNIDTGTSACPNITVLTNGDILLLP